MSDIAIKITDVVGDDMLRRMLRARMKPDHPIRKTLTITNKDAVILDGVFVINAEEEITVESIDRPTISRKTIRNRLPVGEHSNQRFEIRRCAWFG
jgi:hypothetical protein